MLHQPPITNHEPAPNFRTDETHVKMLLMNSKKGKRYDQQFKHQAIELLIHSGKTQAQIARDLGIGLTTLEKWKRAYLQSQEPLSNGLSATDLEKENRELRRQLDRVRTQHEILKKALGILSEQNLPTGMP
jgi:transposase